MTRRQLLKSTVMGTATLIVAKLGLLWPRWAFAARPAEAFAAETPGDALAALFGDHAIEEDSAQVEIDMAELAENGAVVPIKIRTRLAGVERIAIIAEKNPTSLIAEFTLADNVVAGDIATRIKLAETGHVIVVAEAQGRLYAARKLITVTMSGCF